MALPDLNDVIVPEMFSNGMQRRFNVASSLNPNNDPLTVLRELIKNVENGTWSLNSFKAESEEWSNTQKFEFDISPSYKAGRDEVTVGYGIPTSPGSVDVTGQYFPPGSVVPNPKRAAAKKAAEPEKPKVPAGASPARDVDLM